MYHLLSGQSSLISKISLSFNTNLNLFHKFMAIPIVSELTDNFPRGGKNIFAPMILSSILSVRQILSVFYLFIYLFIIIIFNLFYLLIINLNNKIQLFLSKKNLFFDIFTFIINTHDECKYLFINFLILFYYLIGGIAPVTWGFCSPLRTEYTRPATLYICPTLGHSFRTGAYVHEKVFVPPSSHELLSGAERRKKENSTTRSWVLLFIFLFGGSFEPLSFASLRLELINKFVFKNY